MNIFYLLAARNTTPTHGCCIGSSSVAAYGVGSSLSSLMFNAAEVARGYTCTTLAVPGHTIGQQLQEWNNFSAKMDMDFVIIQVGMNNTNPTYTIETILALMQELVDTILATTKPSIKIILATNTPARARFIDLFGEVGGEASYQKWLMLNEAIMGRENSILGAHLRLEEHTALLNDGNGNLLPQYNTGDNIHSNDDARNINATVWRDGLRHLRLYI